MSIVEVTIEDSDIGLVVTLARPNHDVLPLNTRLGGPQWGTDSFGSPYFDSAGADPGESALFVIDPSGLPYLVTGRQRTLMRVSAPLEGAIARVAAPRAFSPVVLRPEARAARRIPITPGPRRQVACTIIPPKSHASFAAARPKSPAVRAQRYAVGIAPPRTFPAIRAKRQALVDIVAPSSHEAARLERQAEVPLVLPVAPPPELRLERHLASGWKP